MESKKELLDEELFNIIVQEVNPHQVSDRAFLKITTNLSPTNSIRAAFLVYLEREPSIEEINFWLADFQLKHHHYFLLRDLRQRNDFKLDTTTKGVLGIYKYISRCLRVIFMRNQYFEVLDIINVGIFNNNFFWGTWIDKPQKDKVYKTSEINLYGWLLGKKSRVVALQIMLGKKIIKEVSLDVLRLDVVQSYCLETDGSIEYCGYNTKLDLRQLPNKGNLVIKAIFSDRTIPIAEAIKIKFHK